MYKKVYVKVKKKWTANSWVPQQIKSLCHKKPHRARHLFKKYDTRDIMIIRKKELKLDRKYLFTASWYAGTQQK